MIFLNESNKSKIVLKKQTYPYILINSKSENHYVILGSKLQIPPKKDDKYKPKYALLKHENNYYINNNNLEKYNELKKNAYDSIDDYIRYIRIDNKNKK